MFIKLNGFLLLAKKIFVLKKKTANGFKNRPLILKSRFLIMLAAFTIDPADKNRNWNLRIKFRELI